MGEEYGCEGAIAGVVMCAFGIPFSYGLFALGLPVPLSPILGFFLALFPTMFASGLVERMIERRSHG